MVSCGAAPLCPGCAFGLSLSRLAAPPWGMCSLILRVIASRTRCVQGGAAGGAAPLVEPVGSVAEWFQKLCQADSGVLYEDPFLQIGVKQQYAGPQGRLLLFLGNKHTAPLTALALTLQPPPGLRLVQGPCPDTLPPRAQLQVRAPPNLSFPPGGDCCVSLWPALSRPLRSPLGLAGSPAWSCRSGCAAPA
jgi:hypothetical protein